MAIGDQMPIYTGMTKTYEEDFSSGLGKFVEDKHIWERQTVINDEEQFYPDQSLLATADKTVFVSGGVLTLRTIPSPSYLDTNVVLNSYQITQVIDNNNIIVQGVNYHDFPTQSNITGIGPRRDATGIILVCGVTMAYTSIVDLGDTTFRITTAAGLASTVDTTCRATIYRKQPYISGMVTTQDTVANGSTGFKQKFGRFGARIKSAKGLYHFPAFWLWPNYEEINGVTYSGVDKSSEKDVWEILGHAPDLSYNTLHQPGYDMRPNNVPLLADLNGVEQWKTQHMQQFQHLGAQDYSPDFSTGFHWVYMDWFTDNTFAFYFEQTPNSGNIIEVANARGAPPYDNGVIDESMLTLNNAYGSNWSKYQATYDTNWPGYTNTQTFPLDFCISDICVEQFDGVQTIIEETETPTTPTYTGTTVVGPEGDISDVVVCLPSEETDRQGTVHEVEAKICYRPSNIPEDKIGIQWAHNFPSPFQCYFVDGSDKQWRCRIHLTTVDTSPLPSTLQGLVTCGVYLIP